MNNDPLLVGADAVYPNQNSSTAPTTWEENTARGAQDGLPSAPGPMLTLTKRSSNQQFLPGGALNPAVETAPICLAVESIRVGPQGQETRLAAGQIGIGLMGGEFVGGTATVRGIGLVGVGAAGDGVRGVATGEQPFGHGVHGFSLSPASQHAGVQGEATAGAVGVRGQALFGMGIGVHGRGRAVGVIGDTVLGATAGGGVGVTGRGAFGVIGLGGTVGVRGDGRAATSGIGVEGIPGPFTGRIFPWAGAFRGSVLVENNLSVRGDLFVSGTKSAVVSHPDGSQRALYAVESPDSWFEDIGRARLAGGVGRVELDPDFASITRPGRDYHVFITAEGPCNGLYVTDRTEDGFEVRELQGGTADVEFSYRILTRRTDVDATRLQPVETPPSDVGEPEPQELGSDLPATAGADEKAPAGGAPPAWPVDSVPWPPASLADPRGN